MPFALSFTYYRLNAMKNSNRQFNIECSIYLLESNWKDWPKRVYLTWIRNNKCKTFLTTPKQDELKINSEIIFIITTYTYIKISQIIIHISSLLSLAQVTLYENYLLFKLSIVILLFLNLSSIILIIQASCHSPREFYCQHSLIEWDHPF